MTRRGLVMIGVLIIIALGALAGAGAMHISSNTALVTSAMQRTVGSRSLALSGVQAVMAELNAQREDLLLGGPPEISGAHTIYDDGARRGVARLIPFPDGSLARPEPAFLNPNEATREMLAAMPNIGPALAADIVAERNRRGFESIGDMLRTDGIDARKLWGDAEHIAESLDPEGSARTPPGAAPIDAGTPLADVLAVYTFEPDIQAGLGDRGRDYAGRRRINLNAEWSDELGDAIRERYDNNAAEGCRQIMENGAEFKTISDIVDVLNLLNADSEDWPEILDSFTTDVSPFRVGLIDINRAPVEILATLPGIDEAIAEEIVQTRDSLADDERATIAWPVIQGLIERQSFGPIADSIAVRSLQYRVRIEAGIETAEAAESSAARAGDLATVELSQRIVFEAVIDLAAPRPRVAYLRDITLLAPAAGLLSDQEPDFEVPLGIFSSDSPDIDAGGREPGVPMTLDDLNAEFSTPATPADVVDLPDPDDLEPPSPDESTSPPAGPSGGGPASGSPSATEEEPDNRIGRWTTG